METCLGDTLHRLEHQRGEYPLAVRIVVHHPPEEAWAHHQQVEDLVKMGELTHETSLVQEVGNKEQLQALCILGPLGSAVCSRGHRFHHGLYTHDSMASLSIFAMVCLVTWSPSRVLAPGMSHRFVFDCLSRLPAAQLALGFASLASR